MAYQLDLLEPGEGLVLALKRPLSPFMTAKLRLNALDPNATFELSDLDTLQTETAPDADWVEGGLGVVLNGRPDSALIRYRRVAQ